jgi:hypothetical protein
MLSIHQAPVSFNAASFGARAQDFSMESTLSGLLALAFSIPFILFVFLQIWHIIIIFSFFIVTTVFACAKAFHAWHITAAASEFGEVNAAEAAILTEATTELVHVIVLGRFVLFIFINPLGELLVLDYTTAKCPAL